MIACYLTYNQFDFYSALASVYILVTFLETSVLPEWKSIHPSFSQLFINAVWEPFVAIEDFLFSLMTLQESEQIDYVSDNWKKVSQA